MRKLAGVAASPGLAVGPAYVLRKDEVQVMREAIASVEAELARLDAAVAEAERAIEAIRAHTETHVGAAEAEVFDAHLMFLSDPDLLDAAKELIQAEQVSAAWAFHAAGARVSQTLAALDDPYLRERAGDVRDVVERVVRILLGRPQVTLQSMTEPSIIVAKDLTPSETAQLDRKLVLGFVTDVGGPTSHSAIMARTLGIPAVVGLVEVTVVANHGDLIVLDGSSGAVVVRPDAAELQRARERGAGLDARRLHLERLVGEPAVTRDGHRVELAANIGNPREAQDALRFGAEGIGLFRTEFLYMDRGTLPDEEEQYQAYRAVLEEMGPNRPVIIRTLDVGGDKHLEALPLPAEANPFLGLRAIRLCLERPALFKTQLRALLRAAAHGRLRIMYPMVQSLAEVLEANRLLAEARLELEAAHVPVGRPEVGIMIEIPAAAAIADLLAPHVDFFSIGTNDLIQYTLAVDRMNERVAHLYQPFHPAILRLIRRVCAAAEAAGKWAGMCGEMAGDPVAAPVLLGLGLQEFSMSAPSLPAVKEILRAVTLAQVWELAASLVTLGDPVEIRQRAEAFYQDRLAEGLHPHGCET